MGTLLSEIQFPEFVDLTRRVFSEQLKLKTPEARQLFITMDVPNGNGNSKLIKEYDTETFADSKPEGTNSKKGKISIGYDITITASTFSKEFEVTLEARNDNRYPEVMGKMRDLGHFCAQRQELDLNHRFTFASSTSYVNKNGETVSTVVGDGLALASTVHTLSHSATTYSNRLTGDPAFSEGAFEAAKLLFATQIYSNLGEWRQMTPNTLIFSSADVTGIRVAKQLMRSQSDPDAVQSGVVNVYQNEMRIVVLPYLSTTATGAYDSTKRRWWFMASTGNGTMGWQAYLLEWAKPSLMVPTEGSNGQDIHNYNWTFSTYCRYGIGILSGKGLVASLPTS